MPSTETIAPPDADEAATTPILLQSIQLSNILSFGADTPELKLNALNILVGANGSGKSNLIDCIALLRSTSGDMSKVIRDGGGVQEWIWKGNAESFAGMSVKVAGMQGNKPLSHQFLTYDNGLYFLLIFEAITSVKLPSDSEPSITYYLHGTHPIDIPINNNKGVFVDKDWDETGSALRLLRDPVNRPELAYLADQYERIRIYRDWQFGRNAITRNYVDASLPQATLAEDFSNLALFLNRLCREPKTKKTIVSYLRDIYDGVDDIGFDVLGGFIQLYLVEGNHTIPAKRLSDGTLHYLCLLAILCDPNPPPLICIEEPELGLHPDILHKIADLLIDASTRTQLIVTTHSEIIVDVMTDRPESILICEKREGQTSIERLDPKHLRIWLDKYRLGELWTSGELGGKRW